MPTTEADLLPRVASILGVTPEQVNGTIYPTPADLDVWITGDVTDANIFRVAQDLGGTVMNVDIERHEGKTHFLVRGSSLIRRLKGSP